MTTITKERLLTIKQWRETYGPGSNVVLPAEEAEELARIALASLEAEPIGEVSEKRLGLVMDGTVDLGGKSTYRIIKGEKAMKLLPLGTKFYTAPPAPIALEAIENAIEYIRSIAFHIDEDDYHGKHIAYFMRQALAWLEGHSCSDDSQGKSDNSPLPRYQVIELTMLVKQLVSQLKKAKPDCKLPDRAMDYLLRNGLVSAEDVLR
ncbi:hypothetical protein DKW17_004707 [Escherichia coli]|uniref:Eaa protein n=8 Tax=root TaxID=1 RepID=A0A136R497_ECOLX|nr:hypothetical protein [Escherichia coli]EFN8661728.1 hypothetical protein [Escherichia coli O2]EFT1064564.1 hypothetical protein [Shigella sonnei]EFW3286174.1 hypothetical protein [Shigella flexneri]EHW72193.1 hypothetical protein ECDEC10C_3736 [Escherichia coli DEC10C]EIG5927094.1 hypothetical protein [Escherichia coli O45:H2]EKM2485637.1 hypothetical protein [Escherichia coli O157]CAB38711.1 hypothetical protein [Enterobacteria phage H19J]